MKIRTGFVSNSSSSSFIVAIPRDIDNSPCPTCGHHRADDIENIKSKLERSSSEDTEWTWHASNAADALSELRNSMWITEGEESDHELDMIKEVRELVVDHDILMGSICNHDDNGWEILNHKDITVIYGEA